MDDDTVKQQTLPATASAMSVYDDIDMDYIKPSSNDLKTLNHKTPILNPRKRARTNN
jgi:hypothetical protein